MYTIVEMLNVHQVAVMLQLSSASVYKLIEKGEIPAVKRGRPWIIRLSDVMAYIDRYFESRPK